MIDIYKEFEVDFLRTRYAGPTAAEMKMAQAITRLRACVEVLETALRHYAEDEYNGHNAHGACARAALKEAKLLLPVPALEAKP
jgi:hypothetical protein